MDHSPEGNTAGEIRSAHGDSARAMATPRCILFLRRLPRHVRSIPAGFIHGRAALHPAGRAHVVLPRRAAHAHGRVVEVRAARIMWRATWREETGAFTVPRNAIVVSIARLVSALGIVGRRCPIDIVGATTIPGVTASGRRAHRIWWRHGIGATGVAGTRGIHLRVEIGRRTVVGEGSVLDISRPTVVSLNLLVEELPSRRLTVRDIYAHQISLVNQDDHLRRWYLLVVWSSPRRISKTTP